MRGFLPPPPGYDDWEVKENKKNEEIINQLIEMKARVTDLGHFFMKKKLPIKIDEFKIITEPFVLLERSFDKAIKKLQK